MCEGIQVLESDEESCDKIDNPWGPVKTMRRHFSHKTHQAFSQSEELRSGFCPTNQNDPQVVTSTNTTFKEPEKDVIV